MSYPRRLSGILNLLLGKSQDGDLLHQWRENLLSLMLIVVFLANTYLIVRNVYFGNHSALIFNLAHFLTIVVCIALVAAKKDLWAKVVLTLAMTLSAYLFSSISNTDRGALLFFFLSMGLSVVLFRAEERRYRLGLVALNFVLIALLLYTPYRPLAPGVIGQPDHEAFVSNFTVTFVLIFLVLTWTMILVDRYHAVLFKKSQDVERANGELRKANEELDRFAYKVSHDLKAPLNSVKGLIDLARREDLQPRLQQYLDLMYGQATAMQEFIRDLLEYAKCSRKAPAAEEIDLDRFFDEITAPWRHTSGERQVTFVKDFGVPRITTDKTLLGVVASNLVANAVVHHHAPHATVTIRTRLQDGCVLFSVSDDGPGIAPEHQTKIFDMFYRASQRPGSGLGLYIAKEMAQKLGGEIGVSSELNRGTTFDLKLGATPADG